MSRYVRIQIVIGLGFVLLGYAVAALGCWLVFNGLVKVDVPENDPTFGLLGLVEACRPWTRAGRFLSVAGLVYTVGTLAMWFIGPAEKANPQAPSAVQ